MSSCSGEKSCVAKGGKKGPIPTPCKGGREKGEGLLITQQSRRKEFYFDEPPRGVVIAIESVDIFRPQHGKTDVHFADENDRGGDGEFRIP